MEDEGKYGPKMRALPNDRWRAACIAFVTRVGPKPRNSKGYVDAVVEVGYKGTPGSLAVLAHRMFHDQRMQEAVSEEGRRRLVALIPMALSAHEEVMSNPQHKDFISAAKSVLDRAGLHAVTEERHVHEIALNETSRQRAVSLAAKLGIPLDQLVGRQAAKQIEAQPIDVEFEVVSPAQETVPARTLADII